MLEPNGYHHTNGNGNGAGNGKGNVNGLGAGNPYFFDPSPSLSDDLRRYLGLLWHWAWLILIITIVITGLGYYLSKSQTPEYRASATLLISESRTLNEYANILASERLAQTYSELMIQRPVLEGVIEQLGLGEVLKPEDLKRQITVDVVKDTQLMSVSVVDIDPVRAAQIANTIGKVFAELNANIQSEKYQESKTSLSAQLQQVDQQIQDANTAIADLEAEFDEVTGEDGKTEVVVSPEQQRERDRLEANLALYQQIYSTLLQSYESVRLAEIQSTSSVRLAEEASTPSGAFRPNTKQDTFLAAVVGLIVSIGLIFFLELLDDTIKGPEDIARHFGLPVLGFISDFDEDSGWPVTAVKPRTPIAEAFRSLRTNIQYASVDQPIRTLLVTSPSPKDGKSTIATNLATVIAQSGRQVALFDADMRRPSLHSKLRLSNRVGLSDLFVQANGQVPGSLRETKVPGLGLLTSGSLPPNPAELVGSEKMGEIMRQMLTRVDVIVVDTPPVMAVTDAAILAPRVDGVLLVFRPGATKLAAAKQTVETLARGGANVLGVVLNGLGKRGARYYYYRNYYVYNHYYGDADGSDDKKWLKRKKRRETTLTD